MPKFNKQKRNFLNGPTFYSNLRSPLTQKESSGFEKAFAAARKGDNDEFSYKGKKYHTGTKEEKETGTGYFDPHNIHARKTEGLKEEQRARGKANCAKKGAGWKWDGNDCVKA
jgi:hypothetical protein